MNHGLFGHHITDLLLLKALIRIRDSSREIVELVLIISLSRDNLLT